MKFSVERKNEMMITKDSIIRRNANGSMFHHGAPMPIPGFGRVSDAASAGSKIGGIGSASEGYEQYNQTNRPIPQGRIGNTDPYRADGAIRGVLCVWDADAETQTVEQDGLKYLLMWTPLQSGEGVAEGAVTGKLTGRPASTMNDPEQTFADPPVGPRAAAQDAHRQMFDRITDHNSKKPLAARRALAAVKRSTDSSESINEANRKFWGGE
jgi:hypothetical protein